MGSLYRSQYELVLRSCIVSCSSSSSPMAMRRDLSPVSLKCTFSRSITPGSMFLAPHRAGRSEQGEIRFAADSLVEEAGFELSVPPAGAGLFRR